MKKQIILATILMLTGCVVNPGIIKESVKPFTNVTVKPLPTAQISDGNHRIALDPSWVKRAGIRRSANRAVNPPASATRLQHTTCAHIGPAMPSGPLIAMNVSEHTQIAGARMRARSRTTGTRTLEACRQATYVVSATAASHPGALG